MSNLNKKIFLSFLGIGNYENCNYFFKDFSNKVDNVKFVQEALLKIFYKDNHNCNILIFLTKSAREKHWDNLKNILLENFAENNILDIDIPEGKTEEEIWDIFEKIYENIPENSEVIFDITHAFRSIPMLAIVVLNYAKVLKNISINGIYYGAVEVLGNLNYIKKLPLQDRNAPIFDLTSFVELLEWANGAYEFSEYGIAGKLKDLIYKRISPRLRKSRGTDLNAKRLKYIADEIVKITLAFATVRGKNIFKNLDFSKIKEELSTVKESIRIKPYKPLINKIENKLKYFETDKVQNLFYAAKFCINHNLIQQSITILQEGLITYYCEKFGFDFKDKIKRDLISQIFTIKGRDIAEDKWKAPANENIKLSRKLMQKLDKDLAKIYCNLTGMRNDINHGGFLEDSIEAHRFEMKIKQYYEKIMNIIFDR